MLWLPLPSISLLIEPCHPSMDTVAMPETFAPPSAADQTRSPEERARKLIDIVVQRTLENVQEVRAETLAQCFEAIVDGLSPEVRQRVQEYVIGLQQHARGAIIAKLEPGVGGQYDGSNVTIAAAVAAPQEGRSLEESSEELAQTGAHERYHEENGHLEPIIVTPGQGGETFVTIAGADFTRTQFIEGLTVAQTGATYVHQDYVDHKQRLVAQLDQADLTLEDAEQAVAKRDMRLINDREPAIAGVVGTVGSDNEMPDEEPGELRPAA